VRSALAITDVTPLAHAVGAAHRAKTRREQDERMADLRPRLPLERPYRPHCTSEVLVRLGMLPGDGARRLARLGRGKVTLVASKPNAVPPPPTGR
jgi:hypothetical protein